MVATYIDNGTLSVSEREHIRSVLDHFGYKSPEEVKEIIPMDNWSNTPESRILSPRQIEIFTAFSQGQCTKAVAVSLYLSDTTLKREIRRVFDKTGTRDKTHAVAVLFRRGILD